MMNIMPYTDSLDVWSPQYNYGDLDKALDDWKNEAENDGETILFSNVKCSFYLGGVLIPAKEWDTFLYSVPNDKLIMLMRGGAVSYDDIKKELDKRGIVYHETIFSKMNDDYADNSKLPQFWTARDLITLDEFIKDSINNENCNCGTYYPLITGSIILSYAIDDNESQIPIEGRNIDGIIEMNDKIILLLKINNRTINQNDVINILNDNKINYTINYDLTLSSLDDQVKNNK